MALIKLPMTLSATGGVRWSARAHDERCHVQDVAGKLRRRHGCGEVRGCGEIIFGRDCKRQLPERLTGRFAGPEIGQGHGEARRRHDRKGSIVLEQADECGRVAATVEEQPGHSVVEEDVTCEQKHVFVWASQLFLGAQDVMLLEIDERGFVELADDIRPEDLALMTAAMTHCGVTNRCREAPTGANASELGADTALFHELGEEMQIEDIPQKLTEVGVGINEASDAKLTR
jgi:hypothetical protein